MDIVTLMNMKARRGCYKETYVNYEDKIDQPLDRTTGPGDIDAWFYSQVPISRIGSMDDELKNYNKQEKKKISQGEMIMAYTPFGTLADSDVGSIDENMPQQMCAKKCTANSCTGFTYDKNYSKGICYIYKGDVKTSDCPMCNTYMRKIPEPVPNRTPQPVPEQPAPAQPLIEVTVYQGENFTRGSTTMKFFEADLKNTLLGMKFSVINWSNKQEVNSFVVTANTSGTWVVSFPSREKAFLMPNFSGKKSYNTLDGAGGYHGSILVGKR
jgi:hypothetical protein